MSVSNTVLLPRRSYRHYFPGVNNVKLVWVAGVGADSNSARDQRSLSVARHLSSTTTVHLLQCCAPDISRSRSERERAINAALPTRPSHPKESSTKMLVFLSSRSSSLRGTLPSLAAEPSLSRSDEDRSRSLPPPGVFGATQVHAVSNGTARHIG